MKTSLSSADKENVLSSRRFQENANPGLRSQSTDQPFRGSASLGFKNMNINIPQAMSPQALSHSNSFSQLKGKILDDQTEAFQKRIAYLTSENEKLHKTNSDLTQENESLKKKEAPAEDKELTEKLGLILAENTKLNFALEKLRETYQKEKALSELASQPELHPSDLNVDQKTTSKGFESMMSNQSTPFMGNKARSRTEHSEARSNMTKNNEEYEKTILTLFVENDKLNDALEQKMKEVQTLSTKLETEKMKSAKASQIVANGENKNKMPEIAEENTSLSVSQDFSGMINNLLQENAKLIEIIHKKDQEIQEFKSHTKNHKNLDESFGKSEENDAPQNPTFKKILSSQKRILNEFKQSSSIVNQFKASTTNLIEENLKINQLISDRMNSLKEDFSHAVGALPADVYQLQAQVELLAKEKEELNNIIKEQLVEIGSLRQQISGPKSQETRSEVYGMSLTTTDGTINYDEQGNRLTSLTDMDKDREFHNLKNMIIDIDSNSNVQREQLEDVQSRIEGLFVGLQTIVNGGRVEFEDVPNVQKGENEDFDGLKSNFSDIKTALCEVLQGMKREEAARAQIASLLQENQKANQTIKEKERMVESLVSQLKKLQEGYGDLIKQSMQAKDYDADFENVLQRVEDIRESMGNMSGERSAENREVKTTVGYILNELNQFKKDFVSYHHELKALKNLTSTREQDKKTIAEEEERLKGTIHNLMQEKEKLYAALRQKDNEFEQIRQQKYDLSEKLNFISTENKNFVRIMKDKEKEIGHLHNQVMELETAHERLIEIQRQREEAAMEVLEEPSKSVVETSFSEESTPVKVQIKRRPLTEEEKIVQENFQGKIDIVFCMDCTRSMDPYILNAKLACEKIMTVMNQSKNTFPLDLMFGFVGYRDHGSFNNGTWVTKVQDLCDIETCMKFINKMDAQSSNDNDFPEAVMPALWDCCDKISWRDNSKEKVLRVVFHIADAPPHGKRFYKGKNDKYPKGDPSGIRTDQIAQRFADMGISYKLLKIGKFLDLMEKIFKQTFLEIDSMELKKAEHLDQMTTTILVKQLDAINNEVSIKDKRFLKVMPKGNIKRSEKIGQCYFTSILFDDYLEYFMEENITDFRVRTLNIFHSQDAIVGVQCVYVTEDEEIEAPARIAHNHSLRQASIEFAPKEYITEISGDLDQKENLTSLLIVTSMNKRIKVGTEGVRKFRVNVPPSGYVLAGVGGSFRNRGIDSIYFYYI